MNVRIGLKSIESAFALRSSDFAPAVQLFCVMKDDAESMAIAAAQLAYSVPDVCAIEAACPLNGTVPCRDQYGFATNRNDNVSSALRSRPLLD